MTLLVATSMVSPAWGDPEDSDGVTARVSIRTGGAQAEALVPGAAVSPAVSAGGNFVAFVSDAANLVAGDANGLADVFVFDQVAGATTRVSVGPDGVEADGPSAAPVMSNNGQFVAFVSEAANLVTDDTNGTSDVFVHDRLAGSTNRVSAAADGTEGDGPATQVSISGLGDFVAFTSEAQNLVAGDDNRTRDVFVRPRVGTAGLTLVSAATGGGPGDDASFDPDVSADGAVVAFASDATDLVAGDSNGTTDVFIRGRSATPPTQRVSVDDGGAPAGGPSFEPSVDGDGTTVAFTSEADDLTSGDGNRSADVFVRDVTGSGTASTMRASESDGETEGAGASYAPEISTDGRRVVFLSDAADLLPPGEDGNAVSDAFLRNLDGLGSGTTRRVTMSGLGTELPAATAEVAVDPAASVVAFSNGPVDPSTGLAGPGGEVLVRGVDGAPATTTVSGPAAGGNAASPAASVFPALSGDGRFTAFSSSASDLVEGDTNKVSDVFVHDTQTASTSRVSVGPGAVEADGPSLSFPFLSSDGRFVAFSSDASNLVEGDTNFATDAFVHDRQTGVTSRVSVGPGGMEADQASVLPFVSGDGRFVTFASDATNLAGGGDRNGVGDVFVHDREAGTTERVSVAAGGGEADQESGSPTISGDGRYVAFRSGAANLTGTPERDRASDVYVHDREGDTTTRITLGPGGAPAGGDSDYPIISPDGRFVTFASSAANLVTGDTNNQTDVFVWDRLRAGGGLERVSVGGAGTQGNRASQNPWVSADGRYVAFDSQASNLVAGDTNGQIDAFIRDRVAGTTTRVSVSPAGDAGGGETRFPTMSADGRHVAFQSRASNLVAGDTNSAVDVFVHDRLPVRGYWMVASDGGMFNYGAAAFQGSAGGSPLTAPVVGGAATPDRAGYWLVGTDGGIFAYGNAGFLGSTGDVALNQPIVGMAAHPRGGGYWLVARDGGIFSFGTARFLGSTGDVALNQPIVGMAVTPSGRGYWLVASDGGIFAFGDAAFWGSTGARKLNRPIVGMAATPSGRGYWLVASDGGIFAFGDARFAGSAGGTRLNQPIVGMSATPGGAGYWLVASDGGIFSYGEARFLGSAGGTKLNRPIVGMFS